MAEDATLLWRLLDARDAALRQLHGQLAQVTTEAEDRRQLCEKLSATAEERRLLVERLAEESTELLHVAEERKQLLDVLGAQLELQRKDEKARASGLRERDAVQAHLRAALEQAESVLSASQTALGQTQAALGHKEEALAATQNALSRMQSALGHKEEALAATQVALADTRLALAARERVAAAQATVAEELVLARAECQATATRTATLEAALQEKERVIGELAGAVRAFRLAHFMLSPAEWMHRIKARIRHAAAPRLGQLSQHPPVPPRFPTPGRCSTPSDLLPRISLVTPSYQQGRFIERTMLSVLDQGYPHLEYIVQDGGSTDGTAAILERHGARLARWVSSPDNGQAHAINLGFAQSTGEIMAWLNSDDLLLPGALARVADHFARHPETEVVYGDRLLIDEEDLEIGRWILPAHDGAVLSWADFVPQETLFWRRSVWERAGGKVDESFRFAMDWDLLLRFREVEGRFVHLRRLLGAFRIHAHQKTSAAISAIGYAEMERLRERVHGRLPSGPEISRGLRWYLAKHVVVDIAYGVRTRIRGAR
ncbi:MAG: glycosyltransferase [Candidatus Latescibacterota bacterium]|jgi:glycosyltransferase involved in cell wall biosynthesis